MKVTPTVAIVPLLLALLTWLSLRAINSNAELFDRALGALDRFAIVESALHRDVLSARAGMLRNYDSLVRETNALDASLGELRETAAVDAKASAAIDRLMSLVARQEALTEQFKSNNALLQNSLAYFGLFIARLGASDRTMPVLPAISGLAAAMLHLTLDTSPATAHEVENWLDGVGRQPAPYDDAATIQALLAHGRLLHDLLPATDGIVKELYALPGKPYQEGLRAMVLTHQIASRTTARHFRLLLYVTSLILVALLVHLGLRLRGRALALQRRAAFEHAIAGISTRFINTQPQAIGAQIQMALAELAARADADRAYFILHGTPVQQHVWSGKGIACPAGWPDLALALAARFRQTAEGIIHIPSVHRLPPGEERDALAAAGVRGWVCARRLGGDGVGAILAFDALRPGMTAKASELGLLRMALDAIANAVGRQLLEREKTRLEQHLQEARRMETVGALTSGIAHNFNNIVGAILGYAEMAEGQVVSDSRPARNLGEIRRAGERARELVDQILTFGRRRDVRRRPVSVQDLLGEAASMLRAALPPGVGLAIHDAPESAVVFGERAQLLQVILNLCNNAAQAMDGSGDIEIHAEMHEIALPQAFSHGDLPPGRYVRIAVSDAGRGMDEATLSRIFEPFFTTRMAGSGLGLATVREIVREHAGAINVRSAPATGTRFEAWLPCIAAAASPSGEELPALPLGNGETVLVVDDQRAQLLRGEEILAALGYEPVGFTREDDALAACQDAPRRFDVLVVGHVMPPASPLELAAALHEAAPHLPILLARAMADEVSADALVAAGVSDVVHWPLIATEMAAALERCSAMTTSGEKAPAGPQRGAFF